MEIISKSEEETKGAAKKILEKIIQKKNKDKATVVALFGDLGSGKTVFVKGLSESLGVKGRLVSPTFIIERRYPVNSDEFSTLIHIDAYRLDKNSKLDFLGWSKELENKDMIICLEWPENVKNELPNDIFSVYFNVISEDRRLIIYTDDQKKE